MLKNSTWSNKKLLQHCNAILDMLLYINVHKLKIHFQNHLMSYKKAFIQILSQALTMTALTGSRQHIVRTLSRTLFHSCLPVNVLLTKT